ncbi:hypothetical protein A3B51_01090 [Candidatus Curtissbacteria bacterium RIFCSPLOWO2_01_FULL_41_18]|uniref:Uncharacterized protein n=2 Tax=Candidatus Curtissiibacteriota TaxID=1752717 RepID=A0A1F5G2B9_9BACT|nr:MAG: hypothetical protein A2696_02235 [Candidatus Curtissbacteria bacterium RIFCSPHIGHO2_01_FULL_41_13]OGE03588.1 MAG: hypothetical protein A3B51_01090 [Candidatus Curtissbacteria bacterium RIFCSPLOWO2_01_FULL_41_18]
MIKKNKLNSSTFDAKINWRIIWYSVVIWLLAFAIGGFVILPWYYLVLPILIFWITINYFKKMPKSTDKILTFGLWISLVWFFVIVVLTLAEIAGFYYFNFFFFFSDFRNWLLFPLVLLVPVVYSLILENKQSFSTNNKYKRSRRRKQDSKVADFLTSKHLKTSNIGG